MRSIRPSRSSATCEAVRRAGAGEQVGAWRRDGDGGRVDQRARDRVHRHSNGDGREARRHLVGHARRTRQDERQGSWPESRAEHCGALRHTRHQRRNRLERSDVDDQRIGRRALLGGEQPPDRRAVEGIDAKAVHGLGRKGHQASAA